MKYISALGIVLCFLCIFLNSENIEAVVGWICATLWATSAFLKDLTIDNLEDK